MRERMKYQVEQCRITAVSSLLASPPNSGFNGAFVLAGQLLCIVSNGDNWPVEIMGQQKWEHVSVSVIGEKRCPTYAEMVRVKNAFWGEEETVVEFHAPRSDHVNVHEHCLHLWKPIGIEIPRPPTLAIGPKSLSKEQTL